MKFSVRTSRLETFRDACKGRTISYDEALVSDDLELVEAAAWAAPYDVLERHRDAICEAEHGGIDTGLRGSLICYTADARGADDMPHNALAAE